MKFTAHIIIKQHAQILDPQGKAVAMGLENLGISGVKDVRVGKFVELTLEAVDNDEAIHKFEEACKKLLANPIMEEYSFQVVEA